MKRNHTIPKITLLVTTAFILITIPGLSGCTENNGVGSLNKHKVSEEATEITSTQSMDIEGVYVDNGYTDKDNESLKMVYVFYTVSASDKNLDAYSKDMTMRITSDSNYNEYKSQHYADACTYMPNYYYSDYIEKVYIGDSLRVVDTFAIPEKDFEPGRTVTLSASRIPDIDQIKLTSDSFKRAENTAEIAQAIDPEGYESILAKHNPADVETAQSVKEYLDNRYWSFYVNSFSYRIEFDGSGGFRLEKPVENSGSYEVLEGYIALTYNGSEAPNVEIPWKWKEDGSLSLDVVSAFDVSEN